MHRAPRDAALLHPDGYFFFRQRYGLPFGGCEDGCSECGQLAALSVCHRVNDRVECRQRVYDAVLRSPSRSGHAAKLPI